MTWLQRRKWNEVESEMRRNRERERERVREKIGGRKVWVGDRGREDIKGERGEQKKENIYIYMARKLALLPPLGKKADDFLWIACLRIVASGVEGGVISSECYLIMLIKIQSLL